MTDTLYDTDFYQWTQAQAAHLRAKEWSALDVDHLAEEIESLGASDRRALRRHLMRLSQHLLKWHYQPQRRGESWQQSIDNARLQAAHCPPSAVPGTFSTIAFGSWEASNSRSRRSSESMSTRS